MWVATVANIDWPSAPGLPSRTQQSEALSILERCRDLNFNAVILQVRPQCDLIYPSRLEPWSYFLSGEQGFPPQPLYDPLSFWIEEAHARGLELHAWINPFRANHPGHAGKPSPRSILSQRPDLAHRLGDKGYYWLDPGHPEARAHTMAVILELIEHYDLDGIHLDDYFYPYPSYNGGADFPDGATWRSYRDAGGSLSRSDWRRRNVDDFVRGLYLEIKQRRPEVMVGISPFGVWRPGHPPGAQAGVDQYETLFADPRLWLREGWLDYLAPQLYWRIGAESRSFPALLSWWRENNLHRPPPVAGPVHQHGEPGQVAGQGGGRPDSHGSRHPGQRRTSPLQHARHQDEKQPFATADHLDRSPDIRATGARSALDLARLHSPPTPGGGPGGTERQQGRTFLEAAGRGGTFSLRGVLEGGIELDVRHPAGQPDRARAGLGRAVVVGTRARRTPGVRRQRRRPPGEREQSGIRGRVEEGGPQGDSNPGASTQVGLKVLAARQDVGAHALARCPGVLARKGVENLVMLGNRKPGAVRSPG